MSTKKRPTSDNDASDDANKKRKEDDSVESNNGDGKTDSDNFSSFVSSK